MSFMKMASMASFSITVILIAVMVDEFIPQLFEIGLVAACVALTMFLIYRLTMAINAMRERQGITRDESRSLIALGIVVLILVGISLHMIVTPLWDLRLVSSGGFIVFLIFLGTRLFLNINLLDTLLPPSKP